jgi:hypothetical protein
MSPPSGTRDEYSRKDGGSGRVSGRGRAAIALSSGAAAAGPPQRDAKPVTSHRLAFPRGLRPAVAAVASAGAVLLVVAEFTTLYGVHVASRSAPIETISGGSNNSYAMIPIAVLAVFLALAGIGGGGRWALAALGVVGLVALLISLVGDLPGAQQSNHLIRFGGKFVLGSSKPSAGMYIETLGAVLLIVAAGLGLLLGESPPNRTRRPGGRWPGGRRAAREQAGGDQTPGPPGM